MGKFISVITAYLLICNGFQIFRDSLEISKEYLIPCYIFLTSVFLLLYDLRLYPKPLRKLDKFTQTAVEFLVATFLMEHILLDFWIPLDIGTRAVIINAAEKLEDSTREFSPNYEMVIETLKSPFLGIGISYVVSSFFLLSVLHAIRAVDFRAFQEGPSSFFGDILYRSKRFLNKKLKALGFRKHRHVKFQEPEEVAKKHKSESSEDNKIPDNLCLANFQDFAVEDYDQGESLNETSWSFNDFEFPGETELLCDLI